MPDDLTDDHRVRAGQPGGPVRFNQGGQIGDAKGIDFDDKIPLGNGQNQDQRNDEEINKFEFPAGKINDDGRENEAGGGETGLGLGENDSDKE